jgi:hypothetical protein
MFGTCPSCALRSVFLELNDCTVIIQALHMFVQLIIQTVCLFLEVLMFAVACVIHIVMVGSYELSVCTSGT